MLHCISLPKKNTRPPRLKAKRGTTDLYNKTTRCNHIKFHNQHQTHSRTQKHCGKAMSKNINFFLQRDKVKCVTSLPTKI